MQISPEELLIEYQSLIAQTVSADIPKEIKQESLGYWKELLVLIQKRKNIVITRKGNERK